MADIARPIRLTRQIVIEAHSRSVFLKAILALQSSPKSRRNDKMISSMRWGRKIMLETLVVLRAEGSLEAVVTSQQANTSGAPNCSAHIDKRELLVDCSLQNDGALKR